MVNSPALASRPMWPVVCKALVGRAPAPRRWMSAPFRTTGPCCVPGAARRRKSTMPHRRSPRCTIPISARPPRSAISSSNAEQPQSFVEPFMTAASPGIIATTLLNAYYDSYEHYVVALARQMQREYEFIHSRNLTLQLDCPDLAMERTRYFQNDSLERFQEIVALHIDAINLAIVNIPPEHIRLHVCWGN